MKWISLYLLVVLLCFSCSHNVEPTLELHVVRNHTETLTIDNLFSEYKIIQPEMTQSSIIGKPVKTLLKNDIIYITDGKAIYSYSLDGKYLQTLDRLGRGPEEYMQINDFQVTENGIYILDRGLKKILRYSPDGHFINPFDLNMYIASFYVLNDSELLLHIAYQKDSPYKFHIYDMADRKVIASFHKISDAENTYRHFMSQSNFCKYDDDLIFHEPMNNDIYKIENDGCSIFRNLNIYDRNPPQKFWNTRYADVVDITVRAAEAGYCYGSPFYAENNNQILFTFKAPDGYYLCQYLKENKKTVQSKSIKLSDKFPLLSVVDASLKSSSSDHVMLSIPTTWFYDNNENLISEEFGKIDLYGNQAICIATF